MRTSGRLAGLLNGIVISTLGACGGAAEGRHDGSGAGTSGGGGDSDTSVTTGGATGEAGMGGRLAMAGSNTGGTILLPPGGSGNEGGAVAGGGGTGGSIDVSTPLCDEQGVLKFVEGLHLPEAVDYLGVYLNQSVGSGALYQSTGTSCSGASDPAACQAALVAGSPSVGFPYTYPSVASSLPPYSYMYLAYTRGDSVGFVATREQLNALLGEIDSANEAGLVFLSMGVSPACNAISESPDAYYYSPPYAPVGCSFEPPGRSYSVNRAGEVASTPVGMAMPCVGRRPVGLLRAPRTNATPLGDYYASVAHLECAAVLAFDVMEQELERFGAPEQLRLRARRARADEVRHYQRMAALARNEGATVTPARAAASSDRSLLEAALENATEGCVREAWGALSAHYQAATAVAPEARQLWRDIAVDETEHAELSLALHDWFMLQLSPPERELVEAATRRARDDLRSELTSASAPHPTVTYYAGTPAPEHAVALFGELERRVLDDSYRAA
jgi:hypothetical protein